ncbi:hypothetical protein ACFXGI_06800 [Streptomyces sp. NPDC059355]|uniref:Rv1733c family protein n=1 Tax=Streptomyces sp. NPDC059355 TaxID=3346811 RepID=UPI0036781BA6
MFHTSSPNPLRRADDRGRTRWYKALVLSLIVAVACGVAAGTAAWKADSRAAREEAAHRHRITATTLADAASRQAGRVAGALEATAQAAWRFPAAVRHTATLTVPEGTASGTPVRIWVDDAGREATPPRAGSEMALSAVAAGTWTAGLIAVSAAGVVNLGLRRLDTRALTAWEREWEQVEPGWSGRLRSGPGAEDD